MVIGNIIYILKTLEEEGFIDIKSDDADISEILQEFNLEEINNENFNENVY